MTTTNKLIKEESDSYYSRGIRTGRYIPITGY
jgi:hypothetical protein